MNYEIVELEGKTVVGKSITTSNSDPKMGEKIGVLWQNMYNPQNGYYTQIKNKSTDTVIGLYNGYDKDNYTVTAGAEVSEPQNPELETKTTVKGKYAKFSVHGNIVTAVAKAWGEIWATKLDRTFTGDFEEYLPCKNCDHMESCDVEKCEECDINIYVAVK